MPANQNGDRLAQLLYAFRLIIGSLPAVRPAAQVLASTTELCCRLHDNLW